MACCFVASVAFWLQLLLVRGATKQQSQEAITCYKQQGNTSQKAKNSWKPKSNTSNKGTKTLSNKATQVKKPQQQMQPE